MLGTVVLNVTATDKDDPSTPNGMVTYKLLNGTDVFSINSKSGEIRLNSDTHTLDIHQGLLQTESVYHY